MLRAETRVGFNPERAATSDSLTLVASSRGDRLLASPHDAFEDALLDAAVLRSRWALLEAQGRAPGAQAAKVRRHIQSALASVWRLDADEEGGSDE